MGTGTRVLRWVDNIQKSGMNNIWDGKHHNYGSDIMVVI